MREELSELGVRHVQVRLTDEEFKSLKAKAGDARGATQKLAREALLTALEVEQPIEKVPIYRKENLGLHNKLEDILNSGDRKTIDAVVPNIEIFHERLRPVDSRKRAIGR